MSLDYFKFLKVIGKGSYGEVWLTQHKKDKKQYVLKKMTLKKASKRERKSAEQEAKLLSRLKHPNIVSYKDSFETDDCYLYIAMQFCEGGDLYARLKEQKGISLEERQVVEWFVQIAMALQYLHERNILHRDLKTQNIFLTKSKIIKVGDLGIARVLETSNDMATTLIGTPYYMSPELFTNKPYNHKSDVWALGCCVYEMATLKHAFNAKDMNSLVYKILKGRMPAMPRQYSSDLVLLIKAMLHQNPDQRPSVNRILKDPYIKKNIAIFLEETRLNHRPSSARVRPRTADRLRSSPAPSNGDNSQRRTDVTDGSTPAVQHQVLKPSANSGVDAPKLPVPPQHAHRRRSSNPPKPDLHPIMEGSASQKSDLHSSASSESPDTIVSNHASEAQPSSSSPSSPSKNDKPVSKKKNNFLQNKAKSNNAQKNEDSQDDSNGTSECKSSNKPKSYSVFSNPKPVITPRPLPVPETKSNGLPRRREDCIKAEELSSSSSSKSSSVSSSKEDNYSLGEGDTPRSMPNLSARERRRQKNPMSQSAQERPDTARLKLRKPPERNPSERVTKAEKSQFEPQKAKHLIKKRQPSIHDSSSSTEEDTLKNEDEGYLKEKEKKNEKKEMNNFISILDNTLRNMKVNDDSDDDHSTLKPVEEPIQEVPEERPIRRSTSMPSAETLSNTGRLLDRIKLLHKDCVEGVGFAKLHKAYEILDKIEDEEVEPQLVDLLGKEVFDEYAGRIWQLKFCEESLYKL